ncbi:MAG: methylmalonyl Co-A mutase-associated GTPase MeaB, partial [Actinomycetia bacterium]|nr:methylmalonyl Co-A mutase-associated GTPase MeaB [Actinomycetes bacterium]
AVNKADGDNAREARVSARELRGAMRLVSGDAQKTPEVLTCSALTGDGLDDVWQAITAHRAALVERGSLERRRAEQQRSWLGTLTETELLDALRTCPEVVAARAQVEAELADGTISAPEGSRRLIDTFYRQVRDGHV